MALTTRRSGACLRFNGTDVSEYLDPCLKSVTYTDPASGDSDSLELTLYNADLEWMGNKCPELGDKISGSLPFVNWNKTGDNPDFNIGSFSLDTVSFSGGPSGCIFTGLSLPADSSLRTRERTKTWENVMLRDIAQEIAGRYSLKLQYDAPDIHIASIEQSQETDSAFLYKTSEDYGVSMKIYDQKLVMYDMGRLEGRPSVASLGRSDWVDDDWTFENTLLGVYTGARINYKCGDDSQEIGLYVGFCDENDAAARTLYINETVGSEAEARTKAAARVNESNTSVCTLSGHIWPNRKIVAGVTVDVQELEMANGKYFIDEMVLTQSASRTEQSIKAHRCQRRL